MPRPVEFDRAKAVDKALVVFWRKGYQASALSDLLDAMDISRSSFYATFESKRALFVECLDLFGVRTCRFLLRAREQSAPMDALRTFFVHTATGQPGERSDWGCMLVNTVLELAGVDNALSGRASGLLSNMQDEFARCLCDAGVALARADELAGLLMLLNEGIRVSSRRKVSRERQLSDINTTFRLLTTEVAQCLG